MYNKINSVENYVSDVDVRVTSSMLMFGDFAVQSVHR